MRLYELIDFFQSRVTENKKQRESSASCWLTVQMPATAGAEEGSVQEPNTPSGPLNVWWGLKYFYVPHPRLCTRRKQGQKKGSQNASSVAGIVVPWLQHHLGLAFFQFWLFLIQLPDH